MMTLSELEFRKLLPRFMREDLAVKGLSLGIDIIVPTLSSSIQKLTRWDKIDELTETELDELAWELNISWYDSKADISVKRELIRNSDMVHQTLGTKWAVEKVISDHFGSGYITEWFEYEGEPGHFRVYSSNPSLNNERLNEFLNILDKVKRATAKLDGVFITLTCMMPLSAGIAFHETGHDLYGIGANPI